MVNRSKRIVVIESNNKLAENIRSHSKSVQHDYDLELFGTISDAKQALSRKPPDLVLLEQTGPNGSFHDIIDISSDAWPIVVMVPFGNEICAEKTFNTGVLDYIVETSGTLWDLPHVIKHSLHEWGIIKERKQLTKLLRESEERYLKQFETSSSGILHLGRDSKVLRVNKAFASKHGYTVQQLLTTKIKYFSPFNSVKYTMARLEEMPEGEELTTRVETRHKDGRMLPFQVSFCLISRESDPYLIAFHRDTQQDLEGLAR